MREYFESATFLLGVSATFVITFFISMIVREFGCTLEKHYFKNKLDFPTNYLMLYQNERLPSQVKDVYGKKIKNDFGLLRLTEAEEITNSNMALKILSQATRLISTKYQQHEQIKDANISYGFARNVSGGLWLSIPFSIIGVIVGLALKEYSLLLWSSFATIVYVSLLVYHKRWIIRNAEKYAEKLFSVYLGNF